MRTGCFDPCGGLETDQRTKSMHDPANTDRIGATTAVLISRDVA